MEAIRITIREVMTTERGIKITIKEALLLVLTMMATSLILSVLTGL